MRHHAFWLAISVAACGRSARTAPQAVPPAAEVEAAAAVFELGEIALLEDDQPVMKIHADGTTELGVRSGTMKIEPGQTASSSRLPLRFKPGPMITARGAFVRDGKDLARVNPDGTITVLEATGPVTMPDVTVTADKVAFAATQFGPASLEVAADGTITRTGGNPELKLGKLRLAGADTPGKRRAILAMLAIMFAPKKGTVTESVETGRPPSS